MIKIHPIACHTSVLVYMKIHSVTSYISQVEVQIPEIKHDEYMAGVQVFLTVKGAPYFGTCNVIGVCFH